MRNYCVVDGWNKQRGLWTSFMNISVLRTRHMLHFFFCSDLPGGLTYDRGGFHDVHHLLQRLYVRVLVSKLLLLVVEMASSLNVCKNVFLFRPWLHVVTCYRLYTGRHITFTMRPLESTIQILFAASALLSPSLAMAIISRWAMPRAACQQQEKDHPPSWASLKCVIRSLWD